MFSIVALNFGTINKNYFISALFYISIFTGGKEKEETTLYQVTGEP